MSSVIDTSTTGDGWLIFKLPPAELGVHPADDGPEKHELYLMCDDIEATVAELREPRAWRSPRSRRTWATASRRGIRLPGGSELRIYECNHPTAIDL